MLLGGEDLWAKPVAGPLQPAFLMPASSGSYDALIAYSDGTNACPQFSLGDDGAILPPAGGWPSARARPRLATTRC